MEATKYEDKTTSELHEILRKKDYQLGQLAMLKRVLELTVPIRNSLPPAYIAALTRITAEMQDG